ncbi:MAG: hypothetical protein ACRDYA_14465 [Egibacteraceae bacterium]
MPPVGEQVTELSVVGPGRQVDQLVLRRGDQVGVGARRPGQRLRLGGADRSRRQRRRGGLQPGVGEGSGDPGLAHRLPARRPPRGPQQAARPLRAARQRRGRRSGSTP